MKKQALAIAIASAMVATPSFAAQDTAGMHYTSASEGFYASIRARFDTAGTSTDTSSIENSFSRIGVRGSNDLGGGLEGFYGWELGVPIHNGGTTSVRLGNVGLRGAFGSFWVGSNWGADYNWTHGTTDVANNASGNLSYTSERPGRTNNAIEYTTPDLNGFQGAFRVNANGGADDNDIDEWNLAANYAVQGFSVAGAYNVRPDGLSVRSALNNGGISDDSINLEADYNALEDSQKMALRTLLGAADDGEAITTLNQTLDTKVDDANSWTFKLGYTQDNWYVNGWYGETNVSDLADGFDDTTLFSMAGGVTVDKVNLYALYDQRESKISSPVVGNLTLEDSFGTIGAQYNLGARSRVWIEYVTRDLDSDATADDYVNIGMRHDF